MPRQIQTPEFGEGLDGVLRGGQADLRGILNGVDYAAVESGNGLEFGGKLLAGESGRQAASAARTCLKFFELENIEDSTPVIGIVSKICRAEGF